MTAGRDLPHAERMPRVEKNLLARPSEQCKNLKERPACKNLKADHGRLHAGFGFRDSRHAQKDQLRARRVNRVRIFFSINVGINLVVTQELKMLIGRDVTIWINPGALYLPVPNITIHIGREKL